MVQFFRSGQHDDRRRRVLTEEVIGSAASPAPRTAPARRGTARTYGTAALRDQQPPLVDFIPQSLSRIALLIFLGSAAIAGLIALYAWPLLLDEARLPAFDLAAEGSLGQWFTSTALAASCIVALVIYSLRRHRLDDYHGRYRVWLWAAAGWLLLSIDEAASLHESLQAVGVALAPRTAPHGELLWIGLYALSFGALGLRLSFEMRASRASTAALLLGGGLFVAAVVMHVAEIAQLSAVRATMIEEGCEMAGALVLLVAMCLHTRHVSLDAQGLLAAKAKRRATPAAASTRRSLLGGRKAKIDPPHDSPPPPASRRSDLVSARADDDEDDEDEDAALQDDADDEEEDDADSSRGERGTQRLSKAERKALRRRQQRDRRARLG